MSWENKGDRKPSTTGSNPCDEIQLGPVEFKKEPKKPDKIKESTFFWVMSLIFGALTTAHWVAFPFAVVFLVISYQFYRRENAVSSRD